MRTKLGDSLRLRCGVGAFSLALLATSGAQAFTFDLGEVKGSLDSTISAGASWRMEAREAALIGIANGGTSRSVNGDDGNLNYDRGDTISAALKATHDAELKYGNNGVFTRVNYFYDFQAESDDEYFGPRGEDRLESEFDLLDAFAYFNFKLNGRSSSVRLGKQVVNWGESTFIGNGINSVNPVDVAKLRTPGSEIKEALLPIPMFWGTTSITDSVSVEALWIWSYQETVIDPRGSFFSTNDFVSDDGDFAYAGVGRRNDQRDASLGTATARQGLPRAPADRPDAETQQYGVAFRYFAEQLNSTEFGIFYLKYHSRTPLVSAVRATPGVAPPQYLADYPEGIELYGLSFNTDGPLGIALQGEYSYRPNQPVQLTALDVLVAANRAVDPLSGAPNALDAASGADPLTAPAELRGWKATKVHQVQMTGTKAFGPTLGAEQFTLLGEAAYNFQELDNDFQFAGPGTDLPSCGQPTFILLATSNGACQETAGGGFADRSSWGYRLVGRMDFENAIGPAQLSPRLVFAHDVNGVSATFNQETKAVTVGLGMNYLQRWQADIGYTMFFDGRNYSGTDPVPGGFDINPGPAVTNTPGDVSQSRDFEISANPNEDRDFLAVNISYAF